MHHAWHHSTASPSTRAATSRQKSYITDVRKGDGQSHGSATIPSHGRGLRCHRFHPQLLAPTTCYRHRHPVSESQVSRSSTPPNVRPEIHGGCHDHRGDMEGLAAPHQGRRQLQRHCHMHGRVRGLEHHRGRDVWGRVLLRGAKQHGPTSAPYLSPQHFQGPVTSWLY